MHSKLPLWLTAASCFPSWAARNSRMPDRPPGLQADVFAPCSAHVPSAAAGDHLPQAGVTAAKASERGPARASGPQTAPERTNYNYQFTASAGSTDIYFASVRGLNRDFLTGLLYE
jgi:hypothetical protein